MSRKISNDKRITLHLPIEDYEQCVKYAKAARISTQAFIRNAIVVQLNMCETENFIKKIDYRQRGDHNIH